MSIAPLSEIVSFCASAGVAQSAMAPANNSTVVFIIVPLPESILAARWGGHIVT